MNNQNTGIKLVYLVCGESFSLSCNHWKSVFSGQLHFIMRVRESDLQVRKL